MINGDVNEFVEHMRYGDELVFWFDGKKYFLQGFGDKDYARLYLDRWSPPGDEYVWIETCPKSELRYPVEEFLARTIWNGKSFWEVQEQMEWVDF